MEEEEEWCIPAPVRARCRRRADEPAEGRVGERLRWLCVAAAAGMEGSASSRGGMVGQVAC